MSASRAPQDCFESVTLDIRTLPLRPEDAFVLSRVDGKSGAKAIANATSLPEARVEQILGHLEQLGAVRRPASQPATEQVSSVSKGPSADQIAKICALHALLDGDDHYALLGLDPNDSSARIKQVYYEYVACLHPDRFFGVELGELRPMLLQVFQRLTEAYKVLTRAASRVRYDAMREQRRQR